MPDDFPTDVRQFIERHVESIVQLEALLLVRQDPAQQWNAEQLAKSLYISPEMSADLLSDLARRGFLRDQAASGAEFSYGPDEPTDGVIGRLASIYQERRVAVISLIYSKPVNKVQTFADAFRLRKET